MARTTDGHGQRKAAAERGETAAALIDAGRELFAERGYAGTSVRALASAAGVNLGAVTYHFGSKWGLYDAVVASDLPRLAEAVEAVAGAEGDPLDRVEGVVRAYFDFLREHPNLPRLILTEVLAGRNPPESAVATLRRILAAVRALVREGQERGRIREGDPVLMSLSIISQPLHLTVASSVVERVAGLDQTDGETARRVVEHAVEFVRAGLEERG